MVVCTWYNTFWVLCQLPETLLIVSDLNNSILNVFKTSGRGNLESNDCPKCHCFTQGISISLSGSYELLTLPLLNRFFHLQ